MRLARPAAVLAFALLLTSGAGAATRGDSSQLAAPTLLHAFLLRADEASTAQPFSRTPAFAWHPVRGAARYEFELGTSSKWSSNAILWSNRSGKRTTIGLPALALPVALPWLTGNPSALYAHVRAVAADGTAGPWSASFGFNMAGTQPVPDATTPGLVRWDPIDGATGYEVWYLSATGGTDRFLTQTNVADERDYYRDPTNGPGCWRVRALRGVFGTVANSLPRVSYGPWSQPVCVIAPARPDSGSAIAPESAVSDATSTTTPQEHELMPAFVFGGDDGLARPRFRVYVSTDSRCVNIVFRSWIVDSPAYAPRWKWTLPDDGGKGEMADGTAVVANETPGDDATKEPAIDVWDNDSATGGYYWTVVPVDSKGHDLELPQDACDAGHMLTFRKSSQPIPASKQHVPYVSGLSPNGRLLAAASRRPEVYGAPLVAWQPARAADEYEVQWGKGKSPTGATHSLRTASTSAVLPLVPGTWWYRVRGINLALPGGAQTMTWSPTAALTVARPKFKIVG